MTRIAYICNGLYNSAGMERVLTTRANFLCDKFDITFITYNQRNRPDFFAIDPRIHRIDIPANNNKEFRHLLTELLIKEQYDITTTTGGADFIFLHSINDGSKKIFESHFSFDISKVWLSDIQNRWKRELFIWGQTFRRIYHAKKYDQIVVLCKNDKKKWSRYCKNVTSIYNPLTIQTNEMSSLMNPKAIAVGRLHKQKGFDYLIDAWKLLHQKHKDWTLEIYGDGPLRQDLQEQIDYNHLQNVVLLKGKTNNIVNKYLDSSIFILSSRDEAFGLVITEAETCGLPIVTFDCPSAPAELVEDGKNGYVVPLEDVRAMSDKICKLIENEKLRKEMGMKSKELSKKFQKETIMNIWEHLYSQLTTT